MVTIYHEEFLKTADQKIKEINTLTQAGKKVEAAKASLEFAKFKVAYYEQFISGSDPITNYEKIYDDSGHGSYTDHGFRRGRREREDHPYGCLRHAYQHQHAFAGPTS